MVLEPVTMLGHQSPNNTFGTGATPPEGAMMSIIRLQPTAAGSIIGRRG